MESAALDVSVPGFAGRPALAVIRPHNGSGTASLDYFADGVGDDLITRLSLQRRLPVIARNSSFCFRSPSRELISIGRELGVRYVVDGRVHTQEDRLDLHVRLLAADSGQPLWQERYETPLARIFDVLETVSEAILAFVDPVLDAGGAAGIVTHKATDLEAWDLVQRAIWHFNRLAPEETRKARAILEKAIQRDPDFILAYWGLVVTHYLELQYQWADSAERSLSEILRISEIVSSIDTRDPLSHFVVGMATGFSGNGDEAVGSLETALRLNPSLSPAYYLLGMFLALGGRPEDGLTMLKTAIRLSPLDPELCVYFMGLGTAHFSAGRYEEAAECARRSIEHRPNWEFAHRLLSVSYVQQGKMEQARRVVENAWKLDPGYSEGTMRLLSAATDRDLLDRFFDSLRAVGWSV